MGLGSNLQGLFEGSTTKAVSSHARAWFKYCAGKTKKFEWTPYAEWTLIVSLFWPAVTGTQNREETWLPEK